MVEADKDLYEALGVSKDATQVEIKKAYMKLALKLHPDKNPGDEVAKERFQTLQRIYSVLGDPERRKVYDRTGSLEDSEELAGEKFNDLYEYYRSMYKKVEEEDVVQFENDYRGSSEEEMDLLRLYTDHKGNMQRVFEWQLCSYPETDSHRFADVIESAISTGKVKKFKGFSKWASKVRSKPPPKNPLKPIRPRHQGASQDLVAMIRGKAKDTSFLDALEAKYSKAGNGKPEKRKGSKDAEPSEADFASARSRLSGSKGKLKSPRRQ